MDFTSHPTWRMLEKAKSDLRALREDLKGVPHYYDVVSTAHNNIIKMQYALEARLCQDL